MAGRIVITFLVLNANGHDDVSEVGAALVLEGSGSEGLIEADNDFLPLANGEEIRDVFVIEGNF